MDIDAGGGVDALGHLAEPGVGQTEGVVVLLEGPKVAQVEDGAQVDVEALGPLTGEDGGSRGDAGGGRGHQGRVVGGGEWPDVARRAGDARAQHLAGTALGDPGHRVGLPAVPVGAGQRTDRPGVVEEGVGVGDLAGELELVGDVGIAVAVVVDVDLVEHVVTELVEVGTAVGGLQRDVVGDEGDGVWCVGADERVQVGGVGDGVLGDLGGLTMGGHGSPLVLVWC